MNIPTSTAEFVGQSSMFNLQHLRNVPSLKIDYTPFGITDPKVLSQVSQLSFFDRLKLSAISRTQKKNIIAAQSEEKAIPTEIRKETAPLISSTPLVEQPLSPHEDDAGGINFMPLLLIAGAGIGAFLLLKG